MTALAAVLTDHNFKSVLYIVAFSLFIYGLSGLTGPKTAVRGNRIAAVGMAIAVITTLLVDPFHHPVLIAVGLIIGIGVGGPAARMV
jgi:NAD(P) transhydrogenase subunit beta